MLVLGITSWRSSPKLVRIRGKLYVKKGKKFGYPVRRLYLSPYSLSAKGRIGKRIEVNGRQRVKFPVHQKEKETSPENVRGECTDFF
jgi:hypothetical protein